MTYYIRKESVAGGEVTRRGPYGTESEARMILANEIEEAYASDSLLARRDVQDEVDAALRTGAAEIANDAGAVLCRISIERD